MFKRQKRLAFLDLLLEAYDKGEISREGVREEVDTFMFEVSMLVILALLLVVFCFCHYWRRCFAFCFGCFNM